MEFANNIHLQMFMKNSFFLSWEKLGHGIVKEVGGQSVYAKGMKKRGEGRTGGIAESEREAGNPDFSTAEG